MRYFRALIATLLIFLCVDACTKVNIQSNVSSPGFSTTAITVVLLSDPASTPDFDDEDIDNCIGSAMRDANPALHVVSARRFRENVYPYFMPSTTPHTLEDYKGIFEKSEVQQRISALGVQYLVVLIKRETVTDWHGGIFCGVATGGGGCLGLSWWDRKSDLGFAIWDLQAKSFAGNVRAKADGTGIMPAFVLPIPVYIPATESAVCKEIGVHLANLLSGQR
jgi:hypothetical protein